MATAAGAAVAGGQAIAISEKAFEAGWDAYSTVSKKGQQVLTRENPNYDFEKVAFQSLYGTALFGIGWAALKMGQAMVGFIHFLGDLPIIGDAMPDEPVDAMVKIGEVLNIIDAKFLMPYGPVMPVSIVSASALLEYARIRINLPDTQRRVSDSMIAGFGLALVWIVQEAMKAKAPLKEAGDPTKPFPTGFDETKTQLYKGWTIKCDVDGYWWIFTPQGTLGSGAFTSEAAVKAYIDSIMAAEPIYQEVVYRTYRGFQLKKDDRYTPAHWRYVQVTSGLEIGSMVSGTYWQVNEAFVQAVDAWIAANPEMY